MCPETVLDGVYSFVINSTSPLGPINLMYVQHDAFRGLPFATTTLHNELNQLTTYNRLDDFRRYDCPDIWGYQTVCENTYNMTVEQRVGTANLIIDSSSFCEKQGEIHTVLDNSLDSGHN